MKMSQLDSDRQIIDRLTDVAPPPSFEQTARAGIPNFNPGFSPADDLVDKFCFGQINESQFMERGIQVGMTLEAVNDFILMVRLEDGTYA